MRRAREADLEPIALNLARIVYELTTNARGYREDLLMADLGIKKRTLQKYVKMLSEEFPPFSRAGSPVALRRVRDGEATYLRLVEVNEIELTTNGWEAFMAVRMARNVFRLLGTGGLEDALGRVESELSARLRESAFWHKSWLRDLDRKVFVAPSPTRSYADRSADVGEVLRAVLMQTRVSMRYNTPGSRGRTIEIAPYTLLEHDGALYVVGLADGEDQVKKYALHRVSNVQRRVGSGAGRFEYPSPAAYHPASQAEGSFGVFTEAGPPQPVRVVFDAPPWLAAVLEESQLHETAVVTRLPKGRYEVRLAPRSLVGVGRWLFGLQPWIAEVDPSPEGFVARPNGGVVPADGDD